MPADANPAGDIFGGWVMAQMDLASGIRAAERARGRVVTAAVKEMAFELPVKIGDTLECLYTYRTCRPHARSRSTSKLGLTVRVTTNWRRSQPATFIMVALDENGAPKPVPSES